MSKNLSASILARLLTLARQRGDDYSLLLNRFALERLLLRLPTEVAECADRKIVITSQSGRIHVSKANLGDGKKVNGDALGIAAGTILGN